MSRPSTISLGPPGWPLMALTGLMLTGMGIVVSQLFPQLDREIFLAIHLASAGAEAAAAALSVLGLGASTLLLASASGPAHPRPLAALFVAVMLGGLLVQALKYGLVVPRPLAVLGPDLVKVIGMPLAGRAMPSGHAAAAFALLVCLALDPRRHPTLTTLAAILALGVSWSRVAAGVHWPSDLLVGAGLGVVTAALICGPARSRGLLAVIEAAMQRRAGSRVTSAFLVALAAFLWVSEREQPEAEGAYAAIAAWGLAAALAWWRQHPGPRAQRMRASESART